MSKALLLMLLLTLWLASPGLSLAGEWRESTRDVYVDGVLDRTAQVFRHDGRLAVRADALEDVVVCDEDSLAVTFFDRDELIPDTLPTTATAASEPRPATDATCTRVDERTHLLEAAGHSILVAPHQGRGGEVSIDELWKTVPSWQHLAQAYEGDEEAIEALREVDRDVTVTVAFGTWCGDSKRYVPRIVKALEEAGNPHLKLRLLSLQRAFAAPLDYAQVHALTNVPTMLVMSGDDDLGRVVETPASESFEADLAAILAGEPNVHQGRWSRDRLLRRGVYRHQSAAGETGTEEWEVWSDGDERLLHSRLRLAGRETEVWQRLDEDGVPSFVEITRREGEVHSRSRHWLEDGRLQAVTRGTSGIVEQKAELPDGWTLLVPSTVATGRLFEHCPPRGIKGGRHCAEGSVEIPALVLGGAGKAGAGRLEPVEVAPGATEELLTPLGRRRASSFMLRRGGESSRWWIDAETGVPLRGELGGTTFVLTDLVEGGTARLADAGD